MVGFALALQGGQAREHVQQPLFRGALRDRLTEPRTLKGGLLADFDEDGILDLCLHHEERQWELDLWFGSPERWLERLGPRGVFPSATYPFYSNLASGDIDGDGDLDLLTAQRLYRGNGAGRLELDSTYAQPLREALHEFADLDADGDLDVVESRGRDRIYMNDGLGHFTESATLPGSHFSQLMLGDVDGDGDVDLVGMRARRLYLNDGAGVFTDATAQLPIDVPEAKDLVDVDGDADLDVLGFQGLLLNDGTGVFSDASATLPAAQSGWRGVASDVDGDGDLDLVGEWREPNQPLTVLWLNGGAGDFSIAPWSLPAPTGTGECVLLPADIDADGDTDLTRLVLSTEWCDAFSCGWNADGAIEHLLNDGHGRFLRLEDFVGEFMTHSWGARGLLADADGDGDLDAFSDAGLNAQLRSNDGAGSFSAPVSLPRWEVATTQGALPVMVAADLESDGDQDVLIGGDARRSVDGSPVTGGGLDRLVQVGGSFTHPDGSQSHLWVGVVHDLEAADIDGDGDPDAVYATTEDSILGSMDSGIALNDGTGSFAVGQLFSQARRVELLDLEQDGDLDVLLASPGVELLRNDAGSWTDVTGQLSFDEVQELDSGDPDRDGDTDVLVYADAANGLHANNGTGVFSKVRDFELQPGDASLGQPMATLADFEGDGDEDVFLGYSEIFERKRSGAFERNGFFVVPRLAGRLELGDVDLDGDLDQLLGGEIHYNIARHVWGPAPAKLGRDFRFELSGDAGAPWALYYSPFTGNSVIPGLGTLLLGTPMIQAASGNFDSRGHAQNLEFIPNSAALVGTTLYWQALVGQPLHYTNREKVTITGY